MRSLQIRRFTCKKCGKESHDEAGGFERFSQKHNTKIVYENIDLCKRCFKRTRKDMQQIHYAEKLLKDGILKEEDISKFQTDKFFRNNLIKENFTAKKGDVKKRNALIKEELLNRSIKNAN